MIVFFVSDIFISVNPADCDSINKDNLVQLCAVFESLTPCDIAR